MHASTVTLGDLDAIVGKTFTDRDGLKLLLQLLDDRIADDKINWKILHRICQSFFVLSFRDATLKVLK